MFKVGQDVVLKNSSQNKVMRIQAYARIDATKLHHGEYANFDGVSA